MGRPAVFLDRDGTVVGEVEYLRAIGDLRLLPGAAEAIRRLNRAGYVVVIATNQSGIARGLLTEDDLDGIHEALMGRLARRGARIDAIYYCPHHPQARVAKYRRRCRCRKPRPGMLLRAARDLDLDLSRSAAVGDSARDLEVGRRAGCRTVLVRTGYGKKTEGDLGEERPDHIAANLAQAATWIVRRPRRGARSTCKRP